MSVRKISFDGMLLFRLWREHCTALALERRMYQCDYAGKMTLGGAHMHSRFIYPFFVVWRPSRLREVNVLWYHDVDTLTQGRTMDGRVDGYMSNVGYGLRIA